jgi:hypothetical protein
VSGLPGSGLPGSGLPMSGLPRGHSNRACFTAHNRSVNYDVKLFSYVEALETNDRSQCPRRRKRGPAAAGFLVMRLQIPPGAWLFVSCERFVFLGERSLHRADHSSRGV